MNFFEGIIYMLWRGVAIGVIISAPMGPVGILCVQRTLEKGRRTGFYTGVGAAVSDMFYCLITGFGLSLIEEFLKANQNIIQVVGSVVMAVFGVYLFRSNPARKLKKPGLIRNSRSRDMLQGFLFTFSNPLIIFLIIGLFARFNFLLPEISFHQYVVGYIFIAVGALIWWWLVSFFIDKVRTHFNLRSMWLINKITGSIIIIFAMVGIVTAFTGEAEAVAREPVYLNSSRGFGELEQYGIDKRSGKSECLQIGSASADTVTACLPIGKASAFSLAFRLADAHGAFRKSYLYQCDDGSSKKVEYPGWGIVLSGKGHSLHLAIRNVDDGFGELYPPAMQISAFRDGKLCAESRIVSDLDMFEGWNSFKLSYNGNDCRLAGGSRVYNDLMALNFEGFEPDSVGWFVPPAGLIGVDYISLDIEESTENLADNPYSHFADPDVRQSYFARSVDLMEGEWGIFDRMLEDKSLRPGGDYRLAVVRSDNGYALVYLEGAVKNADKWTAGMLKGRLLDTGYDNIFDVEWLDPAACRLHGEIKAQFSKPDLLTLHFADHASTLRLRKDSGLDLIE